jgi:DNA-binding response OmpR family regulator
MTTKPLRVLLAEDEQSLLTTLTDAFVSEGMEVDPALSGDEALRKAEVQRPDVILLDLLLPGRSGLDVLAALKANARSREIPVIMLTSVGDEESIRRGLEAGAVEYIVKTRATLRDLVSRVRRLHAPGQT